MILVITGVEDVGVLVLHQRPLLLRAELWAAGHRREGRRVVLERRGRVLGVGVAWGRGMVARLKLVVFNNFDFD